jgi:hypothetical protein
VVNGAEFVSSGRIMEQKRAQPEPHTVVEPSRVKFFYQGTFRYGGVEPAGWITGFFPVKYCFISYGLRQKQGTALTAPAAGIFLLPRLYTG